MDKDRIKATRCLFSRRAKTPRISVQDQVGIAEVFLYDIIGMWGIDAETFSREIAALDVELLRIRINSPGGDVFDGMAIHNAIARHPARTETWIDGLAASAASYIALAGDEVFMADNALLMIHDPWSFTLGNARDHRKEADILDKISDQIIGIYARKTGMEADELKDMMAEETWLTAEEALDQGFVDQVVEPQIAEEEAPAAKWNLKMFENSPPELRKARREVRTPDSAGIEAVLREAGFSRNDAKAIIADGVKAVGRPREATSAQARSEAEEIRELVSIIRPKAA